ncbi:MAG: hypothetical protein D6753_07745 [Planctomycetota bacterium]|nr:MAG: hypothetical protein D6753_07745 [Planctomycetota bacterium]
MREFIVGLAHDANLRSTWSQALSEIPFTAFRWEMPPVAETTADRPMECVVIDRPRLRRTADPQPFQHRFTADPVTAFPSLGGDAMLIVPCPPALDVPRAAQHPSFRPEPDRRFIDGDLGDLNCYAHLAAFLRNAPADQIDALWQRVGAEIQKLWDERPVWINTAGAGVAWLHIRLDRSPKYYSHRRYRNLPEQPRR